MSPSTNPELVARIAAVLRRRVGRRQSPIHLGDLVVDPVTRSARVDEREVWLANKEYARIPHSSGKSRARWQRHGNERIEVVRRMKAAVTLPFHAIATYS